MSYSIAAVRLVLWAPAVYVDGIFATAELLVVSRARHLARILVERVFVVRALPVSAEAPSSSNTTRAGNARGVNLLNILLPRVGNVFIKFNMQRTPITLTTLTIGTT